MSSMCTSLVWTQSKARGSHKLVLLALAEHADRRGEAELSLRDMAGFCGLSKSRIEEIVSGLIASGELRLRSAGAGRGKPNRYWITLRSAPVIRPEHQPLTEKPDISDYEVVYSDPVEPEEISISLQQERTQPHDQVSPPPKDTLMSIRHGSVDGRKHRDAAEAAPKLTQQDVNAVLTAAGISAPPDQPLFWNRQEHRDDLLAALFEHGCTLDELCTALRATVEENGTLKNPRRMSEIASLVAGKVGK